MLNDCRVHKFLLAQFEIQSFSPSKLNLPVLLNYNIFYLRSVNFWINTAINGYNNGRCTL